MLEHLKVHSIEKMKIFRGLQRAQVSIPGWNYAQQWVEGERNDLRCEYFHIPKATLLSTGITQTSRMGPCEELYSWKAEKRSVGAAMVRIGIQM